MATAYRTETRADYHYAIVLIVTLMDASPLTRDILLLGAASPRIETVMLPDR
jgi:hypothetical protein